MRVRLKSSLDGVTLSCWYEIPQKSKDAYIEDLIKQLHSDLELGFSQSELALDLDEYDLPRRARIEGVLREGDVLILKKTAETSHGSIFGDKQLSQQKQNGTQLIIHGATDRQKAVLTKDLGSVEEPFLKMHKVVADAVESFQEDVDDLREQFDTTLAAKQLTIDEIREELFPGLGDTDVADLPGHVDHLLKNLDHVFNKIKYMDFDFRDAVDIEDERARKAKKHRMIARRYRREFKTLKDTVKSLEAQLTKFTSSPAKAAQHLMGSPSSGKKASPVAKSLFTIGEASSSSSSSSEDDDGESVEVGSKESMESSTSDDEYNFDSASESGSSSSAWSSTSSSPVEELSSKIQPGAVTKPAEAPTEVGVPYHGSPSTWSRNERRKKKRLLQKLILTKELPSGSNFRLLEKYLESRQEDQYLTLDQWQLVLDTMEQVVPKDKPAEEPAWDYPAVPEPGWEKRLIVKEIECETDHIETRMEVQQYEEDVRSRKRKRLNDENEPLTTIRRDNVVIDADMYGDAVVTNGVAPVISAVAAGNEEVMEEGEVEDDTSKSMNVTSAPVQNGSGTISLDVIHLPDNVANLPKLSSSSPSILPGAVIGFRHMEMINFAPRHSPYKTARVLEMQDKTLLLELAKRDWTEPMYDYEGDRVHGPFDVVDEETGEVQEGQMCIERDDLMDIVCLVSASS